MTPQKRKDCTVAFFQDEAWSNTLVEITTKQNWKANLRICFWSLADSFTYLVSFISGFLTRFFRDLHKDIIVHFNYKQAALGSNIFLLLAWERNSQFHMTFHLLILIFLGKFHLDFRNGMEESVCLQNTELAEIFHTCSQCYNMQTPDTSSMGIFHLKKISKVDSASFTSVGELQCMLTVFQPVLIWVHHMPTFFSWALRVKYWRTRCYWCTKPSLWHVKVRCKASHPVRLFLTLLC